MQPVSQEKIMYENACYMKLETFYEKSVKGQKFENYALWQSKNTFPDVKTGVCYGGIVFDPIEIALVGQKWYRILHLIACKIGIFWLK